MVRVLRWKQMAHWLVSWISFIIGHMNAFFLVTVIRRWACAVLQLQSILLYRIFRCCYRIFILFLQAVDCDRLSRLKPIPDSQVFISMPGDYSRKPPIGGKRVMKLCMARRSYIFHVFHDVKSSIEKREQSYTTNLTISMLFVHLLKFHSIIFHPQCFSPCSVDIVRVVSGLCTRDQASSLHWIIFQRNGSWMDFLGEWTPSLSGFKIL